MSGYHPIRMCAGCRDGAEDGHEFVETREPCAVCGEPVLSKQAWQPGRGTRRYHTLCWIESQEEHESPIGTSMQEGGA